MVSSPANEEIAEFSCLLLEQQEPNAASCATGTTMKPITKAPNDP